MIAVFSTILLMTKTMAKKIRKCLRGGFRNPSPHEKQMIVLVWHPCYDES